jgi:putative RNA 2'-phosphotransferase
VNEKKQVRISKFLSLILRHQPEKFGLKLETGGWVKVDELLAACAKNGNALTREELETVVAENDKNRFSFDESGTKIRANQGHSAAVEIEFEEKAPPGILYHGTAEKNVRSILENGLRKMRRHHVHLSSDVETARRVGIRYGKPVIFEVDTTAMREAGFKFYISANGVWLVEEVAPCFLKLMKQ